MSGHEDDKPLVVKEVSEISWFDEVLSSSKETLRATSEDGKPSWYKQYESAGGN